VPSDWRAPLEISQAAYTWRSWRTSSNTGNRSLGYSLAPTADTGRVIPTPFSGRTASTAPLPSSCSRIQASPLGTIETDVTGAQFSPWLSHAPNR
jgi:hypothetical protein